MQGIVLFNSATMSAVKWFLKEKDDARRGKRNGKRLCGDFHRKRFWRNQRKESLLVISEQVQDDNEEKFEEEKSNLRNEILDSILPSESWWEVNKKISKMGIDELRKERDAREMRFEYNFYDREDDPIFRYDPPEAWDYDYQQGFDLWDE